MVGSHQQLRARDDDDDDHRRPTAPRAIRPPVRGRPSLQDDLYWAHRCHVMIERRREYPTLTWAAIARAHGISPRTFQNWRRTYDWLDRHEPERLRNAIERGIP